MKKYFIHLNGRSVGPYSFEELRNMRIQQTTPVWFDGLGGWKNAGDVLELKGLFVANPQTFYQQQNFSNQTTGTGRSTSTFTNTNLSGTIRPDNSSRKLILIIVAVVMLLSAGAGVFIYNQQQKQKRLAEEMMRDMEYQENIQSDAQAMMDSLNEVVVEEAEDYGSSVYSGRFNNYTGGILTVKGSGTDNLEVRLEYNSSDGCTGSVSGTAREIENHKIKMKTSDGCTLNIRYSTGFVTIEESAGCSSAHGSDCSFDGIYSEQH